MQENQVWSLGQEDPLEQGMATHSMGNGVFPFLPGQCYEQRSPQEPGGLQSMELQRVGHDWMTNNTMYDLNKNFIQISKWISSDLTISHTFYKTNELRLCLTSWSSLNPETETILLFEFLVPSLLSSLKETVACWWHIISWKCWKC